MTTRRALVISAIAMALSSAYVNFFLNKGEARVPRDPLPSFPVVHGKWTSSDQRLPNRILENLGVDEYIMRRFTDGRDAIWLYIGYYGRQREGAAPHSPRHCYPGSGFAPIRNGIVRIPVNAPGRTEIRPNLYVFARGTEREVVVYWYQSRGRAIADEYEEKIYLIRDVMFRNRSDGALVRFSIGATAETEETAIARLTSFVESIYPHIPRVVPD